MSKLQNTVVKMCDTLISKKQAATNKNCLNKKKITENSEK